MQRLNSLLCFNKKPRVRKEIKLPTENTRIPATLLNHIIKYVPDVRDAQRYGVTCSFYNNTLLKETELKKEFMEVLRLIATGVPQRNNEKNNQNANMERLKALLAKNCNLEFLTLRGSVVNKGGCTIESATILEMAWGEDDIEVYEMIQNCFKKLNAEKIAASQIDKRFPEEEKETKEAIQKRKETIWDPIVAALIANDNNAIQNALVPFRKLLKPRVITQGKHLFYKNLLVEAKEIYNHLHYKTVMENAVMKKAIEFYNQNGYPDRERHDDVYNACFLFCKFVVGWMQRRSPAIYVAQFCAERSELLYSSCKYINRGIPFPRRLQTKDWFYYGSDVYPKDPEVLKGCGIDFFACVYKRSVLDDFFNGGVCGGEWCLNWSEYLELIQRSLVELNKQLESPKATMSM